MIRRIMVGMMIRAYQTFLGLYYGGGENLAYHGAYQPQNNDFGVSRFLACYGMIRDHITHGGYTPQFMGETKPCPIYFLCAK